MGPKKLRETLIGCVKNRLPVLIKGAPGVGKSDVVMQVADETNHEVILTHPVVSDPTDFKGLPGIVDGKAEFLPFGDLRALVNAKKPTICFLDDLGQAPAVVQAAAMQLILARRVNGHQVSDKVIFLAATNRREDNAGVTGILNPVKSRFATIVELVPEKDDWIEWALHHDMPAEIIGFVHFRPSMLTEKETTRDIVNHPCPRTLAHAGKLIAAGLNSVEVLGGAVGDGCASELVGFIRVYQDIPNIDSILMDPKKAKVPTSPAAKYAVVAALTQVTTKDNVHRVYEYAERLDADFSMLLVRDTTRRDESLTKTKAFISWAAKHRDFLM